MVTRDASDGLPGSAKDSEPQASAESDAASSSDYDDAQRARRERILALKRELVGGDLLTAAEVGEILDIHPRTVGEYIRDGKLHAFQFGGGWKISEATLRTFVKAQSQVPIDASSPTGPAVPAALPTPPNPSTDKPSPPASGKFSRRPQYKCSFCGKPQEEVRRLIAGPGGVYICDACIQLCNDIIAKETAANPA